MSKCALLCKSFSHVIIDFYIFLIPLSQTNEKILNYDQSPALSCLQAPQRWRMSVFVSTFPFALECHVVKSLEPSYSFYGLFTAMEESQWICRCTLMMPQFETLRWQNIPGEIHRRLIYPLQPSASSKKLLLSHLYPIETHQYNLLGSAKF